MKKKKTNEIKQLMTRWGRQLDRDHVLQEYPRPQLQRDSYLNLNGEWAYGIGKAGDPADYEGKILVPFSPETLLSGVGRILGPDEMLYYRRQFTLPKGFKKDRVLLHFGAVDQQCEVWVNGHRTGEHRGGYLAFSYDITDFLVEGENELTVSVTDRTEHAPHARGKQKLHKSGRMSYLYYTPQSGIWKTVWLESVARQYLRDVKITPFYDKEAVGFYFDGDTENVDMSVRILDGDTVIWQTEGPACKKLLAPLQNVKPWTPESPHLYDVWIRWGEDEVRSYFGMRKLSAERDAQGILRFYLNNRPCFFNGVLDQGYWPESLMTPPSDEALLHDIIQLKKMGFNTIRKHIKVESDRFYYHCDRLGMMVWQDMPNGGGDYNMFFVTYLPNGFEWFGRVVKDSHYRLFKRSDVQGRQQYNHDLKGMVRQLYNHPCIAAWVPFNEGWGQFDAGKATALIRKLDGSRLINEACGWFDQGGGDMYSIHNYLRKLQVKPAADRVVALTEYGGYAYVEPEHVACQKRFGYKSYASREELAQNYRRLWQEEILPNLRHGLSAAIYTQTSDIEEEINGLMTYDREVDKMDMDMVKELNENLYHQFEKICSGSL